LSSGYGYNLTIMNIHTEKIPNPKDIKKEIGEFLSKKYGDQVKMISPIVMPHVERLETDDFSRKKIKSINFDLKPEELIAYLDQYVIRQDLAKQVEDFQKQSSVMKEDARKRKAEELEKKMQNFQKQGADAEKQLQQFQQKELAPLFQKLEGAVKSVSQENKLDMVLDKRNAGLLFMDPKLDITDKVRSKFGN